MTTDALRQPLPALGTSNRLAKSATSEALADRETGRVTDALVRLYARWGAGGAGVVVTGNVAFDVDARTEPGVVVIEDDRDLAGLSRWAQAAQAGGARALVQINHAGRQTPKRIAGQPVAPSAVMVQGKAGMFGVPRALTDQEIHALVEGYARAAEVSVRAGFSGVQIHAAHGYLVSQFLSPLTNLRGDAWGGDPQRRMRFLIEIVRATRARIGASKILAVKLNSADFQRGGFDEDESMNVVRALEAEGIDLLEISGGNYERSAMTGSLRASSERREAYFIDYAEKVRAVTKLPLMLTGGLRTAAAMNEVVARGAVDVVGMARPLVVQPELPGQLLRGEVDRALEVVPKVGVAMLDDMLQVVWYQRQIRRTAAGLDPIADLGRWSSLLIGALLSYAFNPFARAGRRPPPQLVASPAA